MLRAYLAYSMEVRQNSGLKGDEADLVGQSRSYVEEHSDKVLGE